MTLYQRYRRLNLWNKIAFFASVLTIISFIGWLISLLPIFEKPKISPNSEPFKLLISQEPIKTNPTIEQEVSYYSRLATAHQWQPPELPSNLPQNEGGTAVQIKFGGVTAGGFVATDGWHYLHPFVGMGGEEFVPYIKDNRLYVKTKTMLGDALQTVEMNDEWPPKIPDGWDRNFNANSFEIVDERMLPVLQVRYDSPNAIEIYGIFVAPNGAVTIAFGDHYVAKAPGLPPPQIPERKAWFKYPSKEHLGELAEQ